MAVDPRTRERLVEVAESKLQQSSIAALRSVVSPAALFEDAGVSRDTAYRAFRRDGSVGSEGAEGAEGAERYEGADRVLLEVAKRILEQVNSVENLALQGANSARDEARQGGAEILDQIHAAIRASFETCLGWPLIPVAIGLTAACMSASERQQAARADMETDQREVAQELMAVRRAVYQQVTNLYRPFVQEAMSEYQIRPRHGISTDSIVALMHAMFEGALQRAAVDPHLLPPDLVATAMLETGLALSEKFAFSGDPRRPEKSLDRHFDELVAVAARLWRDGGDVDVQTLASLDEVDAPAEVVRLLFPTTADLADSVMRWLVFGQQPSDAAAQGHPSWPCVREALRRLSDAVAEVPRAAALLDDEPEKGTRLLVALEEDLVLLLAAAPVPSPERTARQLVDLCRKGPDGWQAVEAMLDLVPTC